MIKTISLVLAISNESNISFWFQKRNSNDDLNGLLELPGGKIEVNETPIMAAVREFKEEVGLDLELNRLNLLKIHTHTKDSQLLFYIYGYKCSRDYLDENGWYSLENFDLFKKNIPAENVFFLKDIIKSL